jgi:malate dehydrogenase (oxaloacetate-decarboxylating)
MEGKAALFATLVGITAVPILIDTRDPGRLVDTVTAIAPSFGAIQLEDIAAPECFEIESELIRRLDRPVLHDDQHGTAVVALAALLTAMRRVGGRLQDRTVGQIGMGAAGHGIARLLKAYGVRRLLGADLREDSLRRLAAIGGERADLVTVMRESDVIIATTGVRGLIRPEWVRSGQLILALSNPDAEIEPIQALERGAAFAADGKSINNVSGFPGLFKGALEARATRFTDAMLMAASTTLSRLAGPDALLPDPLDLEAHAAVTAAVRTAASTGSGSPR